MFFFFSSRRRHTRWPRDWSSDVCSSDLIARLTDWLIEAERPLIIASSIGRAVEETMTLARIAERLALPVVAHTPRYLCLPTDHQLHHGFDPHAFLEDADLILVVEA